MPDKIFINLPVNDLNKSMEFFKKLGFTFNEQFTDETAAAMVITDSIYVMLLTKDKFKGFTKKEVVDAHQSTEVLNALSVNSKDEVDEMIKKVLEAGGKEHRDPKDHGFMYERSFEDLDGHIWEIFWMNPEYVE